jgi:hypothetical protein
MREGEEGNFERRQVSCFATLVGEVEPQAHTWYLPEDPGFAFYQATDTRSNLLPGIRATLSEALDGTTARPLLELALPLTVGMSLYEDRAAGRYFVDLYNLDIDLESDTIRPAAGFTFSLELPSWLEAATARVLSGEGNQIAHADVAGKTVTINVGQLRDYACIVLTHDAYPGSEDGFCVHEGQK